MGTAIIAKLYEKLLGLIFGIVILICMSLIAIGIVNQNGPLAGAGVVILLVIACFSGLFAMGVENYKNIRRMRELIEKQANS